MDIGVEYTGEIKEYYEAEKYFRKKRKMAKFDKACEILIIIIGIFTILVKNYVLGIAFIFFGIFLLSGLGSKLVTYIYFNKFIKNRGDQKIIFSEEKIIYLVGSSKSELGWDFYENYIETENTILLIYDRKKRYGVIPKRVFSNEDLKKLLELLNKKFKA